MDKILIQVLTTTSANRRLVKLSGKKSDTISYVTVEAVLECLERKEKKR